jgi:hypothetical protein
MEPILLEQINIISLNKTVRPETGEINQKG